MIFENPITLVKTRRPEKMLPASCVTDGAVNEDKNSFHINMPIISFRNHEVILILLHYLHYIIYLELIVQVMISWLLKASSVPWRHSPLQPAVSH